LCLLFALDLFFLISELAAGVAKKLQDDFKSGSLSGKALSADHKLASKLAQEVQAQLKGLTGAAKTQLEVCTLSISGNDS